MILGTVNYAHDPEETGSVQWCRVRPVLQSSDYLWVPIDDVEHDFPSQGLVYWYGPPREALKDTYWIGDTFKNPGAGEGNRPDRYGLSDASRPYEFVELRGHTDHTDLRRLCAAGNFSFSHVPIGPILVKIPGTESEWVGPLELDYQPDGSGRYVGSHDGLSGFLSVHDVPDDQLQEIPIEGAQLRILRPRSTIGGTIRWFNAQDDSSLLQSALRRIRKVDRATADAMEITRSVFEAYVDTLQNAELLGDLALKEKAREEALQQLITRVEGDFLSRQEVADALLEQESVRSQLEGAIERRVEELGASIAQKAEARHSELIGKISESETRLEALKKRSEEISKEIIDQTRELETRQGDMDRMTADLGKRLKKVVSKVISHPVDELGRHAVIRALIDAGSQQDIEMSADIELANEGPAFSTVGDLTGALIVGAKSQGVAHHTLVTTAASLLSRRIPILFGNNARACANMVGSMIAGDNVFEVSLPSNVYGITDLLRLSATGLRRRVAITLSEILECAESADELVVIVISGLNRAPLEAAFEDLVPDSNVATSSVFVPLDSTSPEIAPKLIRVAENVLLIGALTVGPTTFRIPGSLRRRVSIVETDYLSRSNTGDSISIPTGYHVVVDSWQQWRDLALSSSELVPRFSLPAEVLDASPGCIHDEVKVFGAVYGEAAIDLAIAEYVIARFAGVVDDETLRDVARSVSEAAARLVDDAVQSGRTQRIGELIHAMER